MEFVDESSEEMLRRIRQSSGVLRSGVRMWSWCARARWS